MTNNKKSASIHSYLATSFYELFVISTPKDCSLTQTSSRSPGAIRMARLRERRELGYRCLLIEVHPFDVEALVRRGFLDRLHRDDPAAVKTAIEKSLEAL